MEQPKTCEKCKFKIWMPYPEEQIALLKKGEALPARQAACTYAPPTPVSIVVIVKDPQTGQPRPMQTIQSAYPFVENSTPACSKFETRLATVPNKGNVVNILEKKREAPNTIDG